MTDLDLSPRDAASAENAPRVSVSHASTGIVASHQPDPWRYQSPALNPDSTVSTTDPLLPASSFPGCDVTVMSQPPVAQQTVDRTSSVTNGDSTESAEKDKSWTSLSVKTGRDDANPSALSATCDIQCRPRQLWNPFLQSAPPTTTIVAGQENDIDDRKNNNGVDSGVRDSLHAMKHRRDDFDELDAAAQKACKKRKLASTCGSQQQQPHAPAAGSEKQTTPHDIGDAAAAQQASTSSDGIATVSSRQQQRGQSPSSSTVDASQPIRSTAPLTKIENSEGDSLASAAVAARDPPVRPRTTYTPDSSSSCLADASGRSASPSDVSVIDGQQDSKTANGMSYRRSDDEGAATSDYVKTSDKNLVVVSMVAPVT